MVLGGFVSRLGYPRPPVFDGAGVPWVLTGTHHHNTQLRQHDGDISAQTLCGWCCCAVVVVGVVDIGATLQQENRTQHIAHLSQRVCVGGVSRVREKNMRMCHAFTAHDEVFCLQLDVSDGNLSQSSKMLSIMRNCLRLTFSQHILTALKYLSSL